MSDNKLRRKREVFVVLGLLGVAAASLTLFAVTLTIRFGPIEGSISLLFSISLWVLLIVVYNSEEDPAAIGITSPVQPLGWLLKHIFLLPFGLAVIIIKYMFLPAGLAAKYGLIGLVRVVRYASVVVAQATEVVRYASVVVAQATEFAFGRIYRAVAAPLNILKTAFLFLFSGSGIILYTIGSATISLLSTAVDGIAAVIAKSLQRSKRATARLNRNNTFVGAVAIYVIRVKLFALVSFCLLAGVAAAYNQSKSFIGLTAIAAMWYVFDISLVYYRIRTARYGSTDFETLEVVNYILRRRERKKGGGGPFDLIFEPSRKPTYAAAIPVEAEGARS